jgi:hypothetical protein
MRNKSGLGPAWFGPKLGGFPGISFMPISWEGWALTAAFALLVAGTFFIPVSQGWHAAILAGCIVAFVALGRTCYDGNREPE